MNFMLNTLALICLITPCVIAQPAATTEPSDAQQIKQLEQQLKQLKAQVRDLERRLKNAKRRAAAHGAAGQAASDRLGPQDTWVVQITHNTPPDVGLLQQQLKAQQDKLPQAQQQVQEAQAKVEQLPKDDPARPNAENALRIYQDRWYRIKGTIRRLERQVEAETQTRIVRARTAQGTPVQVIARGPNRAMAETLRVGQTYQITGQGKSMPGGLRIQLHSVTPH